MRLEWYVYKTSHDGKYIEKYNIFDHERFCADIIKTFKKIKKRQFCEDIKKTLMYYFCDKSEYELKVTPWVARIDKAESNKPDDRLERGVANVVEETYGIWISSQVSRKIDIYDQVMLNFNSFIDYIQSCAKRNPNQPQNKQISLFDEKL